MQSREREEIVFMAQFAELPEMLSWVRERLDPLPMNKTDKRKVELAVEEALVNIIRYAYKSSHGRVVIGYGPASDQEVVFSVQDEGLPFNPLANIRQVPKNLPLEQREIGGLGILFMFELMDEVEYDRRNGRNILTLKKKY